ncbi:RabGAP/TBC [Hesseltinella vesiculosa]|uniref:RabGAP/TBC n=1 Tax=Hesseltinella vesiculosa TaxID=101127 RepID=A0A1X2GGN7_9FUNG|nr:RabGAP/TBC [Hesseltinella vesiculosa]
MDIMNDHDTTTTSSRSTSCSHSDDDLDDVETAMTTPTTSSQYPSIPDHTPPTVQRQRAWTSPTDSGKTSISSSSSSSQGTPTMRTRANTFTIHPSPMIATTFRPSDFYRVRQRTPSFSHLASTDTQKEPEPSFSQPPQPEKDLTSLRNSVDPDAYDWDFWAKVINDVKKVKQDPETQKQICLGMPPSLRGTLWQLFSEAQLKHDHYESIYRDLLDKSSPHEKIIRRDLARTFPAHTFFRQRDGDGQELLFNVIKAYSLYDPQVGYCQGLPFVVGCLLLHMPDEATFCLLIHLMHDYGLRGHFTPKMERLHERLYQLDQLLLKHLPQVHRHLEAQGVRATMYASPWFMTLFAYRCPLPLVFRILDMIFVQGSAALLNVALAFIQKSQSTLLSLEFESLLAYMANDIFDPYQDDPVGLVQDALSFELSSKELAKMAKQHQAKAAKQAKWQNKEDHWRQQNHELTQRAKQLERSYHQLETEHHSLAKQVAEDKMSMARASEINQSLKRELTTLTQNVDARRHQLQLQRQGEFDALAKENTRLVQRHAQLQDQLADVEATLIDFKLKYAQSENEYEQMRNMLGQIKKLTA